MNFNIIEDDYLLVWYLIYGASLSKEFDKLKQSLYTKYQQEYNDCYKDRQEIIKYGDDFIPDNDILYDEVFKSKFFKSLKKETMNHRIHIERLFNNSQKEIDIYLDKILRINAFSNLKLYIIHPRLERIDYFKKNNTVIWGSEKVKFDALKIILINITKGLLKEYCYDEFSKKILKVILELCVLNEFLEQIDVNAYNSGDEALKLIKMQIYPYWLMYLGYIDREDFIDKMIKDHMAMDVSKYRINKDLKKLNIIEFFNYLVKNKERIFSKVVITHNDIEEI